MNPRLQHIPVVDDAPMSKRVYKPAYSPAQALCMIAAEWGRYFDPDVVDAMVEIEATFRDVARRFNDGHGGSDT